MSSDPKPPVADNQTIACPRCGRANLESANQCWLCFQSLESGAKPELLPPIPHQGPSTMKIIGIVFGALGIVAATVLALFVALFVICIAAISG